MSRLTILLENKPPKLQGSTRYHRIEKDGNDVWPDFKAMVVELRQLMGPRNVARELGMSHSTVEHCKPAGSQYWPISFKQGVKLLDMYEEMTQKPIPYL